MVTVQSTVSKKKFEIRMKMAEFKNNSMMTSEWGKAVKRYKIEEDDIVLFHFEPTSKGGLELLIVPLP